MSSLRAQFEEMNENALTIPNFLSLMRIVIVPFFVFFFMTEKYLVAMILIAISGFTDLFDGKIARRFNQVSKLGKLLDPAADKVTQITLSIVFFSHFNKCPDSVLRIFSYFFLLFCLKEVVMVVGSFFLLSIDIVPQAADMLGKVATFAFYGVMGLLLCFAPGAGAFTKYFTLPHLAIIIMVSCSILLMLAAFISYMPDTIRQLKARKAKLNEAPTDTIVQDSEEG